MAPLRSRAHTFSFRRRLAVIDHPLKAAVAENRTLNTGRALTSVFGHRRRIDCGVRPPECSRMTWLRLLLGSFRALAGEKPAHNLSDPHATEVCGQYHRSKLQEIGAPHSAIDRF